MRLISYNILDGGEGRADPLAEVLEAQRPDVVVLVEADFEPVVERIARRLGMDFAMGDASGHSGAILSRWPISQTFNHAMVAPIPLRSFLEAVVIDPVHGETVVAAIHLTGSATIAAEEARLKEIDYVLDATEKSRATGRRVLLCGDFNSNSPKQNIDPNATKQETRNAFAANGNNIPRKVVQRILDGGYVDAFATIHDESWQLTGSFDTQNPGQRVDYIFTANVPQGEIRKAWIEQDRLAKYASDHFPIGVEIA